MIEEDGEVKNTGVILSGLIIAFAVCVGWLAATYAVANFLNLSQRGGLVVAFIFMWIFAIIGAQLMKKWIIK